MGTVSQACLNMKAFVIVALVAAVSGEADPYTIGQVLAGQTNGGVLTSTTYHGGVKVAGFPYTKVAAVPHTYTYGYPYAYYGKREAEAEPALDCWSDCCRSSRRRGNQGWASPQRWRDHQRRHRSHCCHPCCLRWLPLRLLRQEGG